MLTYRDKPLKRTDAFPLLGYYLTSTGSRNSHIAARTTKMNAAFGMWRRIINDHPGLPPYLAIEFFNGLVNAVGQYGNAMLMERSSDSALRGEGPRDDTKRKSLRTILGLPKHSSTPALFALTGQYSMVAQDHVAALCYWANIPRKDPSIRAAYRELRAQMCLTKSNMAHTNKGNFAFYIRSLLIYYMGETKGIEAFEKHSLYAADVDGIVKVHFRKLNREAITKNGKLDFWRLADVERDFGYSKLLNLRIPVHRRDLIRFVTSGHELEVETGRRTGRPHQERLCPFGCGKVENEEHFLYSCEAHEGRRQELNIKLGKIGRELDRETTIWVFMDPPELSQWDEIARKRGLQALATFISQATKDRTRRLKQQNFDVVRKVSDPSLTQGPGHQIDLN